MDSFYAFSDIRGSLSHLAPECIKKVENAFVFAKNAHFSQSRISGEPYICHPLAVASILGFLRLDHDTIIAGLLHDVVEDTEISIESIAENFGQDVAAIVDGVTKITGLKYRDRVSYQAENYRKMFLAMSQDIRVIFVKLADRLHNMRTCQVMSVNSKRRIARETLEIYAPIAKRLGMHNMSLELFELGFAACYPMRYSILLEHMYRVNSGQADILSNLSYQIQTQAKAQGIEIIEMAFREKQLYGIYQKMILKRLSFSDLMDVYALRICVKSVGGCYQLLGIVHGLYRPKERHVKDYIAAPKQNGYQSLHTVLHGPYGMPIEIQIRTPEMHLVATKGVAAHWVYKAGMSQNNQKKQQEWFKKLVNTQQVSVDDMDYLSLVKTQVFSAEVYVLTPKGKVLELRQGATVLDVAYLIHTDIGHQSVYAKVDGVRAPLNQVVRNGQTIMVHTSPTQAPSTSWLDFVITTKARTAIKQFIKDKKILSERKIGQHILTAALKIRGDEGELSQEYVDKIAQELNLCSANALYVKLAQSEIKVVAVADLYAQYTGYTQLGSPTNILVITGEKTNAVKMGTCCFPIPGDRALASTTDTGVEVHRTACRLAKRAENSVVKWDEGLISMFATVLRITTSHQSNNLAYIVAVIADMKAEICSLVTNESKGNIEHCFNIRVKSLEHLALIIQSLNQVSMVHSVKRELKCGLLSSVLG